MSTILLPWNLGTYDRINGFHPLLQRWVEIQSRIKFIRPYWGTELTAPVLPPIGRGPEPTEASTGLAPIFDYVQAREFFSLSEFQLIARLKADVEFHHTVPFTASQRPFIFHCEAVPPIFLPFFFQGRREPDQDFVNVLDIYRRLFNSDKCLAIYSHLKITLSELDRVFKSDNIRRKLRYLPLMVRSNNREACRRRNSGLTFLFTNSAAQYPHNLVGRGAVLAIKILDMVRRVAPEATLIVAGRGAQKILTRPAADGHAGAILSDPAVQQMIQRNFDNIVWVDNWLHEASVNRLFRSADFLLLPSIDLHSSSIMRAMNNGCIPVVSDAYGVTEIVSHRRNGIVVNILGSDGPQLNEFGFSNTDHQQYLKNFWQIVARLEVEVAKNLDVLVNTDARRRLAASMVEYFEQRFCHCTHYEEFSSLITSMSVPASFSGDIDNMSREVDCDKDFARVGRHDVMRVGTSRLLRYGPSIVTVPEVADDWRATSLEPFLGPQASAIRHWGSLSAALFHLLADDNSRSPGLDMDLLPRLKTHHGVAVYDTWDIEVGDGDTLLPPVHASSETPIAECRITAAWFAPHSPGKVDFRVGICNSGIVNPVVVNPGNRLADRVTLALPKNGVGSPWTLALRAGSLGMMKLSEVVAVAVDGTELRCEFGHLSGVTRSRLFVISRGGKPGHAIYGPYLSLLPGQYLIRWCAFCHEPGDSADVLLSLEILAGERVLTRSAHTRSELGTPQENHFEWGEAMSHQQLEFRITHHGNATVIFSLARLIRV